MQEQMIHSIIDKKFDGFRQEYSAQMAPTEKIITKNVSQAIKNKVEQITNKVANQVETQIMAVFQQYMLSMKHGNGTNQIGNMDMPMILQELPSTPQSRDKTNTTIQSYITPKMICTDENEVLKKNSTDSTDNVTIHCSPHDNPPEQFEMKNDRT